jgi:DNA-binding PadR family transcriptional regulator
MIRHIILGLLYDGGPRHGYQLKGEYEARSGAEISTGTIYRELARLARAHWVTPACAPVRGADARRIPYVVTAGGRESFDRWMVSDPAPSERLCERLLFADRLPPDLRGRVFRAWEQLLHERAHDLVHALEDATGGPDGRAPGFDPRPALLRRRMRDLDAELELLEQLRGLLHSRAV